MQYTTLGASGVKVSRLCLGTMNFGLATDQEESFAILDLARERGVNFLDTADFYGLPAGTGVSESILGRWLSERGCRDELVLATKAYATMEPMGPNDRGLSAYHLRRACMQSLKRLQTDHIDVYYLHHYDRGLRGLPELANVGRTAEDDLRPGVSGTLAPSFSEILDALQRLWLQDKITYFATANFPAWALTHLHDLARERNLPRPAAEQCHYNLSCRKAEVELAPACRALGVGLVTYSPLEGGLLGGWAKLKERSRLKGVQLPPERERQLKQYDELCGSIGLTPADVAMAWLLSREPVSSVVLGPRTAAQLADSLRVLEIELPRDFLKKLDEIFPGPGAEAPEFYGW